METARCIGARPQRRTLEELRRLSEAIIGLVAADRYRAAAIEAMRAGGTIVFLPVGQMTEQDLDDFARGERVMVSCGNTRGEPCYPSLEAANAGRNEDGSQHGGYFVVDVVERLGVNLINRDGSTRMRVPLVRFATADKVMI